MNINYTRVSMRIFIKDLLNLKKFYFIMKIWSIMKILTNYKFKCKVLNKISTIITINII